MPVWLNRNLRTEMTNENNKELTEWDYILLLTKDEMHNVTIWHDNPDFFNKFDCRIDYTFFSNGTLETKTYFGASKLSCLKKAYRELTNKGERIYENSDFVPKLS